MNEQPHRPIRSFVMRTGRMTSGQARALEELWPRFGVEYSPQPLALDALFGRHAPPIARLRISLYASACLEPFQEA